MAVKGLNSLLCFAAGDPNSNVAIMALTDLLREADWLGSLVHQNLVRLHGIVLPSLVRHVPHAAGEVCRVNLGHGLVLSNEHQTHGMFC